MGKQTIRLGRIFGLEISFNWSLIFIFLLVAWTMSTEVLPAAVPDQAGWAYWGSGLVGALVFYGCLLAHEVSHALVARRKGITVTGITLWLFGGVTQLGGEPRSAADESLITVVGPLTSLVIAGIGFGLTVGMTAVGAPALLTNLVVWLALLNLVLGVFNLVPAIPLDGGRLLSSLIWWRTGSRERGIHNAVRVGRMFASLVIAAGVLEIFFGSLLSGIWLAFIGWFLFLAGRAEERQLKFRSSLKTVRVSAAMAAPGVTIPDWLAVDQLLGAGAGKPHLPIYPLHDPAGSSSGFVSWQDLLALTSGAERQQRLRDFAQPREAFPIAGPDEDLEAVLSRVGPALERGVLVMEGYELVGILSSLEVARIAARRQMLGPRPRVAA
jgi:Zn-dependent protease